METIMNTTTLYLRARKADYRAAQAWHAAKTIAAFEALGDDKVRIRAEADEEHPFWIDGEPEGYVNQYGRRVSAKEEAAEIQRQLDLNGNWYVIGEFMGPDGEWTKADATGGCMGYSNPCDPFQNPYVVDLMGAAISAHEVAWDEGCRSGLV